MEIVQQFKLSNARVCVSGNRQRDKGFTLIELLVVIAIISLLVSILLPSLTKAKELARRAVCLSNLHNWAILLHIYAGDNSEMYPPASCSQIGQPSYGVRPGFFTFNSREQMESFPIYQWSKGTAQGFWNCPNILVDGGVNPPYEYMSVFYLETGYQYLGDGSGNNNWTGWSEASHAPRGPIDSSQWPLMADLSYRVAYAGPWVTRAAGHIEGGGGVYASKLDGSDVPPYGITTLIDGGNQVFNDGSGQWFDFEDMTAVWSISGVAEQYWFYR